MSKIHEMLALALGGAIAGSILGVFAGAFLGIAVGLLGGDVSPGFDGALLGGAALAVAGALYGGLLALQSQPTAEEPNARNRPAA